MEKDLYKIRSLAHCTKAAYDLYCNNLKSIVGRTWKPAAALALIFACLHLISLAGPSLADVSDPASGSGIAWGVACLSLLLLAIPTLIWLVTCVTGMLSGHPFRANLPRIACLLLYIIGLTLGFGMVIGLAVVLLSSQDKVEILADYPAVHTAIVSLVAIIVLICLVPTSYSVSKYYMEKPLRVSGILGKSYRQGWRHWGFLFAASLLVSIVVYLLGHLVLMPVTLIRLARQASLQGQFMGDPDGLPSYFSAMDFVVTLICTFLWFYILMWGSMVFYYVYGTVEAKIRLRQQKANAMTEHPGDDRPAVPMKV